MAIRKTCSILLWAFFGVLIAKAQSSADVAKSINAIKRDTMYIYAEATMKDLNEASVGARAILEMKVGDWVHSQLPNEEIDVCIVKAKDHLVQLETQRGDYFRAFVYVRKNDIMPVTDRNEVAVFNVSPKEQTDIAEQTIISEDAKIEETPALKLSSEEEQMKQVESFYEIEPYIKRLKSSDRLAAYGKYVTLPKDEDCHLFVYDKQGNISALIRKSGSTQYNLNTLKEDNVKNYKNCGAIWFQLK